nr:glycosyltransferase family 4 protein [Herpetosiphonaceae bacterium]
RDPVMHIPVRLAWQQWELPRRARATRADLLHATGFDAPLWQPLPLVYTVHDLIGMLYPQNLPPVARFYWSRWLPWSVHFARHIIADSQCTQRDLHRLLAVPLERITVVPLAADGRFVPQPPETNAALRARLHLAERMILYVGTIEPRKGIDTLLDAWALLAAELPDTQLVIAGKLGWYTERLHLQIEQLGLAGRVLWTGYVADEDLPALYSAADVFVFPSRYEGFGLPPLEAMACGTPVVVSNAAALPEVVGAAGLLHPPNDAIALARLLRLVLNQPALHAELRARGLRQARSFSWWRTAQQTAAVYRAALAGSL